MEFEGKLTISRVTGGKSYISIQLDDKNSRTRVVDIKVSPEIFGEIITGLSYQSVSYKVYCNSDKFGKNMENKVERVVVDCGNIYDNDELIPALKRVIPDYEIDGWEANINDSLSRQNSKGTDGNGKKYVNVYFRRWV